MPTNRSHRRCPRRPDVIGLSEMVRQYLMTGGGYFKHDRIDLETLTAAWQMHRDQILPEYIAKNPGKRPFAWWLLTHRKERPIVNRGPLDAEVVEHYRRQKFGFLHTSILIPAPGPSFVPFQEPEPVYLARNGLLTPEERAALNLYYPSPTEKHPNAPPSPRSPANRPG